MNIKIVLGTDNQFYFMADNKIIHKLSQEDLKLVIPTTKSETMEILRKNSMEKHSVLNVPKQPLNPKQCFCRCNPPAPKLAPYRGV